MDACITPLDEDEVGLAPVADGLIETALKAGATDAEVSASKSLGYSVEMREGVLEQVEHSVDQGISLTVYVGSHKAQVSTTDLAADKLQQLAEKAIFIAKSSGEDEYVGLASPNEMAFDAAGVNLKLYHPWSLTPEQAVNMLSEADSAAKGYSSSVQQTENVSLSTGEHMGVYANSAGFLGHTHTTLHQMSCSVIAEQNGEMQRDYDYTMARNPKALVAPSLVGENAARLTTARCLPRTLQTTRCPVIFHTRVARSLVSHLLAGLSGGNQYRKTSFLLDSLGEKILPDWVDVSQNPHIYEALRSAMFDGDGVRTKQLNFVSNGEVDTYLLSAYSARRLGMWSTGNAGGVFNARLSTTGDTFDALLKKMGRGLLVTELMGQGVNIASGDYSRGAFGYWVEGGEIQYPVTGITIASDLRTMFKGFVASADDAESNSSVHAGSILIDEMVVAGESS